MKKKIAAMMAITILLANSQMVRAKSIDVPQEIVDISEELGNQYNICPELIQALCFKESSFRTDAVNGECTGIMQIAEKYHKDRMCRMGVTDLFDVKQNMMVGVNYLAELIEQYEDVGVVLMMYNGDSSAEDVLAGSGNISSYADEILTISEELERKNGK